ncbi:MAG: UDP-N-acetylglucosamine 2-epimerase [Bacteroidales bacterium]|nr:UDP-N-acetylglucosamine 2-epimerase [Bacteroidales bacterium]
MKIAPFIKAIEKYNNTHHADLAKSGRASSSEGRDSSLISHTLVHTGQHYDVRMSESFFESLGIPNPDINLEIGSGSHAEQVGQTMIAFEKVLEQEKPDWVVVLGDVNATLACSVAAKKLHVKVCHIEAGLRSGDESMPEENQPPRHRPPQRPPPHPRHPLQRKPPQRRRPRTQNPVRRQHH